MNSSLRHSLLRRQLKRCFGPGAVVPAEWTAFVNAVDAAYRESDHDRGMLERALELSSQELLQAGAEMRAVFQAIPDLLIRCDAAANILECKMGVMSDSSPPLSDCAELRAAVAPAHVAAFRDAARSAWAAKRIMSAEYALPGPSGPRHFEARIVPVLEDQVAAFVRDITARKRAESLRVGQNGLLEMIGSGLPLSEILAATVYWMEQLVGGVRGAVFRASADGSRLRVGVAPHVPAEFLHGLDQLPAAENVPAGGPCAARRQITVATDVATDPAWRSWLDRCSQHGIRACAAAPVLSAQHHVLATVVMYCDAPLVPGPGELELLHIATHIAGIAIERQRHEEERGRLEEQFRHAQKMDAIGRLAGGVAHDFNNLLTVIMGNLSMVRTEPMEPAQQQQAITDCFEAARRAANLTGQLLTFSRRQPISPQALDLKRVVATMAALLRRMIGETVTLRTDLGHGPAWVRADAGMMEQMLMNLTVNARDAMSTGGELLVSCAAVDLDAGSVQARPAARPGPFVRLTVTDHGTGIEPELLPRIFEPFFTTKEVGRGTGLGLATVFGIVEQHGGWLEVDSKRGMGTTMTVFLPRLLESPAPAAEKSPVSKPRGGTESVLIVEDETAVRQLMHKLLEGSGYRVATAEDARGALRTWRSKLGEFDLLITDLVMPGGVSGQQLAQALTRKAASLAVLYCSGYADDALGADDHLRGTPNFIEKPFESGNFLTRVRAVLDARKTARSTTRGRGRRGL